MFGNGTPAGAGPDVVVIGSMPPPVTGQALVNQFIVNALETEGRLLGLQPMNVDLSLWRPVRVAIRGWETLRGLGLLAARAGAKNRRVYLSVDAGLGNIRVLALAMFGRALGYQVILHHHSFLYIRERTTMMAVLSRWTRGARHIFLCGCMRDGFGKIYAGELGPAFDAVVISNRVFTPRQRPPRPAPKNGFTIGHLSNLTWEKGTGEFLDLFEALLARGVDVRAVLAGPCHVPDLKAKIDESVARHPDRLRVLGPVSGDSKESFFSTIDFFVFPSRYKIEAQPLVLEEARARGLPIVSTDLGCIGEDHAGPGNLIVPPDDDFTAVAGAWFAARRFEAAHAPGPEPTIRKMLDVL
jgi:glycosyltransferase involved in cell wall biosynthesis